MKQKIVGIDKVGCLTTRVRYIVMILGSACISSIASNMIVYNFTKICMNPHGTHADVTAANYTKGQYEYNKEEESYIMYAVAIGTLLAAYPFIWLYERYGARYIFFIAGMISTVSTAVIPLAAAYSFYAFLVARFFQGISFGADFTAIGLIVVHWASLKQHGIFIAFLSSFSQISVMFTMPIAGELCESSWGWPSVYYVHSVVSFALFCLWLYYYRDLPTDHSSMTDVELEKITRGKEEHIEKETTPYWAIMKDPVIWAVWLAAFGELLMSQFIVMYGPTYLNEVLNYRVSHTGYFVAVPRALHLGFKIFSGFASDKITCMTETTKMKLFNTIALKVSGVFFCILGFLPPEHAYLSLFAILIIECSTGCICGGFYKCATLVARQHSHFVLSQIQFIKCLSLFIEPLIIYLTINNNTQFEWRTVFLIHGVLLIGGNVVFWIFATDKPAAFTHSKSVELKEVPAEQQRLTLGEDSSN